MSLTEPDSQLEKKRRRAVRIYFVVFVVSSCIASVALSFLGYIPLDPITASFAGAIAGFAFAVFQLMYLRFVGHSSLRMQGEPPRPE